jgi:hypothetical protein
MQQIQGIRFYPDSLTIDPPFFIHGRIEQCRSDFDYIFRPIYDLLEDLNVEDLEDVVQWPWDMPEGDIEDRLAKVEAMKGHAMAGYYSGKCLDILGPYVQDDWNELLLVSSPFDGDPYARSEWPSERFALLHDWDGIYWECFSNDPKIIDALIKVHKGDEHLNTYKVDHRHDYPNPRGSSPEDGGLKRLSACQE